MSRKIYVLGNWKLHKSFNDLAIYFDTFNQNLRQHPEIDECKDLIYGIAPSYISIQPVVALKTPETFILAQDICGMGCGAYTAQISCKQLLDYNVTASLIGHSETRMYLGCNDERVNIKAKELLNNNMLPVICIGESLRVYEKGKTKEHLEQQVIATYAGINPEQAIKTVIAYEPLWAIGTGKTPTNEEIQNTIAFIRSIVAKVYSPEIANQISILYGGSANDANCLEIISNPDVDGLLIGGASLDATKFFGIISKVQQWITRK